MIVVYSGFNQSLIPLSYESVKILNYYLLMYKLYLRTVFILSAISLFLISCRTEDPFAIEPPDFSTVPEAYNIENLEPVAVKEGVEIYQHEEGTGDFFVTIRDDVWVFLTLRTDEGEIIFSTFANGNVDPVPLTVRASGTIQSLSPFNQFTILRTYTPGFKAGILGMQQGEKRTIVVSPENGFGNVSPSNINAEFRENKLIYDVRVSIIGPAKIQE